MALLLMRIDDRLIHGQVVEGWLGAIGVNHIIIASNEIASDKFQQTLLTLALPPKFRVSFLTLSDAAAYCALSRLPDDRILILINSPAEALELLNAGVELSTINVGGMHYAAGKKQVLPFLSVDELDRMAFKKIHDLKVTLEGRVLPGDQPIDIMQILGERL
jgi:PTS system mannose-specific IIB component